MHPRISLLFVFSLVSPAAFGGNFPTYTAIPIPVGAGRTVSFSRLNAHGQVLVAECGPPTGDCALFLWSEKSGRSNILTYPAGGVLNAYLNDRGDVAASFNSGPPSYVNSVAMWTEHDGWQTIPGPTAVQGLNNAGMIEAGANPPTYWYPKFGLMQVILPSGGFAFAGPMNAHGTVTGTGDLYPCSPAPCTAALHAYTWDPSGGLRDLGIPAGWQSSWGDGINDLGDVAGTLVNASGPPTGRHLFLWTTGGGMEDLGPCSPGSCVSAQINNRREIAGFKYSDPAIYQQAYFWSRSTGMLDIGHLGGNSTMMWMLNDSGEVVGQSKTGSGGVHAFVWSAETGMFDLTPDGEGRAEAINNDGSILGTGPGGLTLWNRRRH